MDRQRQRVDEERPEHERRWIVSGVTGLATVERMERIRQAYLGSPAGSRVRITGVGGARSAEMMIKTGRGVSRTEKPAPMSLESAELAFDAMPFRIWKRRCYTSDGFEVNFYQRNLRGLITVEYEMRDPAQAIVLPDWMCDPVEVTDTVCDELLARLAYDLDASPGAEALRGMLTRRIPFIVFTGGPGGGKSSAIRQMVAEYPGVFHVVPEVASIVIGQVGAMPPFDDPAALRRYNRALGDIQRSFETVALHQAIRDGRKAVILDRGTMDNAMYVPGGTSEIERIYMSSASDESARYAAVIVISVPSKEVYERHMTDNPARYESYDDVLRLGRNAISAWERHANIVIIPDFPTWEEKYASIRAAVIQTVGL